MPVAILTKNVDLLELKRRFSSSNRTNGTDCCRWEGFSCDPFSGNVTSLDRRNFNIIGSRSSTLFNLTSLRYLHLASNDLNITPFPASGFEGLTSLTYLNLSHVGFYGQIPIGIAHLTNLVSLDISLGWSSVELHNPSLQILIGNLTLIT
jgi:hypothetical protein